MTGLLGDATGGDCLGGLTSLQSADWMERESFESGEYALGMVNHGRRDPGGWTWWADDRMAGAIYGAAIVPDKFEGPAALFERVLEAPLDVLPALEGGFVLVAVDADSEHVVLATDKLGTRPCYYSNADGFRFGTRLRPIIEAAGGFTLDRRAVNDLLMIGYMWGDETLAERVKAVPPASVVTFDGSDRNSTRYWKPDYAPVSPSEEYLATLTNRYREAVEAMAGTIEGEMGIWLSGGLDSRSMLAALTHGDATPPKHDIQAYTYDSNPPGGPNPEYARRIAAKKSIPHRMVELTPADFIDSLENAIDATDGMETWGSLVNLSSVYGIPKDRPGVIVEAAGQGELLGEQIRRWWLTAPDSAVESMQYSEAALSPDRVSELLTYDVDPLHSFKREAARSDEDTMEGKILDAHFQNHYARYVYASNNMARTRVGTRVPYAYGPFLDHVAGLPTRYRMGSFPFTEGAVPYGASRPKLALIRMLDASLADAPYERTGIAPSRSYETHVAGYVTSMGLQWLETQISQQDVGHVGTTLGGAWYRNVDDVREYIDDLLDGACDRPMFDASAVQELRSEHLAREADHIDAIASITTLEQWLRSVEEFCRFGDGLEDLGTKETVRSETPVVEPGTQK